MLFNSAIFILFAIVFFWLWPTARRRPNVRYAYLIGAAALFYGSKLSVVRSPFLQECRREAERESYGRGEFRFARLLEGVPIGRPQWLL